MSTRRLVYNHLVLKGVLEKLLKASTKWIVLSRLEVNSCVFIPSYAFGLHTLCTHDI